MARQSHWFAKAMGNRSSSILVVVATVSSICISEAFVLGSKSSRQVTTTMPLASTPGNPFSSMARDFVSSLTKGEKVKSDKNLDTTMTASVSASWTDIRSMLEKVQTPEERAFRDNLPKGYGVGSPLHKVRLYDESNKEEDIRVTFYRDSASWCPYCQKVWFTLEEKQIPYKIEKVNMNCYGDKPRAFLQLQPNGQIPVAIIDGQVYGQSNDILSVLENGFPAYKSLLPPKGQEMRARDLLALERSLASVWLGWLRAGQGSSSSYSGRMDQVLGQVESALEEKGGPFFLGSEVSIVDVQFLSFLERMCASLLFFKGYKIREPKDGAKPKFPAINRWFDALESKPSYRLTKSDYYTHCWDLPPQLGGCTPEPEAEAYRNAINGERTLDGQQGSWEFPLQAHNGGIEPDWYWIEEDSAIREAVERMSVNHEALVAFAARGAGRKGIPPVMAPLADPNAIPSDAVKAGVDAVLRTVSLAMLEGTDKHEPTMTDIAESAVKGGRDYSDGLVASLTYLRDRIGVPRDMTLPAARQLRAQINWAIGKILNAQ